jgi:hypothetical protein
VPGCALGSYFHAVLVLARKARPIFPALGAAMSRTEAVLARRVVHGKTIRCLGDEEERDAYVKDKFKKKENTKK